ncbi:MAG: iron-containing alcohol dehydrogenase [Gammaproteobacteria bacterium]
MQTFSIARLPRIKFGVNSFSKLIPILMGYGKNVLVVTGGQSFVTSEYWEELISDFSKKGINKQHCRVDAEPSPELIDSIVSRFVNHSIDVVVGIGGGSVLDAAKAIAGLLKTGHSVMDYLEGVGPELTYSGPAVPFIAVPTTAGTGSEATKNAVLSRQGKDGFKKSFRDDSLVAEYAIIDPALLKTCTPNIIAANCMDALTQLIESYVSIKSNALTDALALDGIRACKDSLLNWYEQGEAAQGSYEKMAYAALLSGICLAQTGLGSVHGLASPLGAFFPIPHGVVCGMLLPAATEVNINAIFEREPENPALAKYAIVGQHLLDQDENSTKGTLESLVSLLRDWLRQLNLGKLSAYDVRENDLDHIVTHSRGSSMKTNPIVLKDSEIKSILLRCL